MPAAGLDAAAAMQSRRCAGARSKCRFRCFRDLAHDVARGRLHPAEPLDHFLAQFGREQLARLRRPSPVSRLERMNAIVCGCSVLTRLRIWRTSICRISSPPSARRLTGRDPFENRSRPRSRPSLFPASPARNRRRREARSRPRKRRRQIPARPRAGCPRREHSGSAISRQISSSCGIFEMLHHLGGGVGADDDEERGDLLRLR